MVWNGCTGRLEGDVPRNDQDHSELPCRVRGLQQVVCGPPLSHSL